MAAPIGPKQAYDIATAVPDAPKSADAPKPQDAAGATTSAAAGVPPPAAQPPAVAPPVDTRPPWRPPVTTRLKDTALNSSFEKSPPKTPLSLGVQGPPVAAARYALARLGHTRSQVSSTFDADTETAVKSFQKDHRLEPSGVVDEATLEELDKAAAGVRWDTLPQEAQQNPMGYLRDFKARGMTTPITVKDTSKPIDWQHPEIQEAYGNFVADYWKVSKDVRLEADCKNLSLHFMDGFRDKVQQDLGVRLPMPRNGDKQLVEQKWAVTTAQAREVSPGEKLFNRFDELGAARSLYEGYREIEPLDPSVGLHVGINVTYPDTGARDVARVVAPRSPPIDNKGDDKVAEVPIQELRPGDLIFMDHQSDGKYDHVVNVVGVTRREDGTVSQLVIATGAFHDMKDDLGSTTPRGWMDVNNFTEEVTVNVGPDGRIQDSSVTWSSEPAYLKEPRFSHQNALMDLAEKGQVFVGRWG